MPAAYWHQIPSKVGSGCTNSANGVIDAEIDGGDATTDLDVLGTNTAVVPYCPLFSDNLGSQA